jgi:hypothetical protein
MPSDGCKGIQFPWRWDSSTITTKLDVIRGMSVETSISRKSLAGKAIGRKAGATRMGLGGGSG